MLVIFTLPGLSGGIASEQQPKCNDESDFTTDFRLQDCKYFKTVGVNPYFKLIPGYKLVLEGEEDGDEIRAEVKVFWDTEVIDLRAEGLGIVKTRVVEERDYVNHVLIEISRNLFS